MSRKFKKNVRYYSNSYNSKYIKDNRRVDETIQRSAKIKNNGYTHDLFSPSGPDPGDIFTDLILVTGPLHVGLISKLVIKLIKEVADMTANIEKARQSASEIAKELKNAETGKRVNLKPLTYQDVRKTITTWDGRSHTQFDDGFSELLRNGGVKLCAFLQAGISSEIDKYSHDKDDKHLHLVYFVLESVRKILRKI